MSISVDHQVGGMATKTQNTTKNLIKLLIKLLPQFKNKPIPKVSTSEVWMNAPF